MCADMSELALAVSYFGSPFFSYPHKFFLALFYSRGYDRAYRHFRSAHANSLNIMVHLLGLVLTLSTNLALLANLDHIFFGYYPGQDDKVDQTGFVGLAYLTTIIAIVFFLTAATSAPALARMIPALCVVGAYTFRFFILENWIVFLLLEGIIHTIVIKYNDGNALPRASGPAVLIGWVWLAIYTYTTRWGMGCLIGVTVTVPSCFSCLFSCFFSTDSTTTFTAVPLVTIVNIAYLCVLAYGSFHPFSKQVNCYWCGYAGWVLAILTNQPWMYLHGAGFIASLMQGVAHDYTKEAANLPELASRSGVERAGDEIGHVAFFPVLITHSAFESLGWGW